MVHFYKRHIQEGTVDNPTLYTNYPASFLVDVDILVCDVRYTRREPPIDGMDVVRVRVTFDLIT